MGGRQQDLGLSSSPPLMWLPGRLAREGECGVALSEAGLDPLEGAEVVATAKRKRLKPPHVMIP